MARWLKIAAFGFVFFVALPSIPSVRVALASPLMMNDPEARGDACYVLASGDAFTERLAAAADLYQMHRVARIILARNDAVSYYNFVAKASWTSTEWALDFLAHRGVPTDRILVIPPTQGLLGTLAEARQVRQTLPSDVRRLVVVSSAPHMRRSLLAFRRILSANVSVVPYAATDVASSAELYRPIWLEYVKLAGYAVVAW
jgi:uncharacterized SAM-binding protein YcdF (DUF218 family)